MNRAQRRAEKKRFVAKCAMCDAESCVVHTITQRAKFPDGVKELVICKGCPCATGMCDSCGETDQHWLGCDLVGIPPFPEDMH